MGFDPGAPDSLVVVSARGHGKAALQRELLAYLAAPAPEPEPAPREPGYRSARGGEDFPVIIREGRPVDRVSWKCPKPTAPRPEDYPEGSYGRWMLEYIDRMTPVQVDYQRRIAAENAAIFDRMAEQLGIKKT